MKGSVLIVSIVIAGCIGMQTADAMPVHHAHVSGCLARQRVDIAPLDRYGGYLPSFAPALMQQMMNPVLDDIRTRYMPISHGAPDADWDYKSPTTAPATQ
jgi:hypothetical protein